MSAPDPLPNYAAAVLDLAAGASTVRVMCYPITLTMLVGRGRREVQRAFSVDDAGRWYSRGGPFQRDVEEAEPSVFVALLDREDGGVRMELCPRVQRVLLLAAWNPKTPQLAFEPDAAGQWIETEATW